MAGIDKIYVQSYEEYAEIRDFFKSHEFRTKDGNLVKLKWFLCEDDTVGSEEERKEIKEWYSDGDSHPATNTPWYVDEWLLHNCPLATVQDYLHDVYENPEEDLKPAEIPVPAKKVIVKSKGKLCSNYPMPFYNGMINKKIKVYNVEVLHVGAHSYWYNEDRDKWYRSDEFEPWTSSMANFHNRSIKSIIRKILKKWRLPAGVIIRVSGKYVGDDWVFETR